MSHPWLFLAARDDSGKIIFGVIFFLIWAISALISWINKQQQAAKRRQFEQQLERRPLATAASPPAAGPPPLPGATSFEQEIRRMRELAEANRRRHQQEEEQRRQQFQQQRQRVRPGPLSRRQPAAGGMPQQPMRSQHVQPRPKAPAARTEAPSGKTAGSFAPIKPQGSSEIHTPAPPAQRSLSATAAPSASAALLSRWLNPRTLRQQYLLTEIFQPPLALRPPRE